MAKIDTNKTEQDNLRARELNMDSREINQLTRKAAWQMVCALEGRAANCDTSTMWRRATFIRRFFGFGEW